MGKLHKEGDGVAAASGGLTSARSAGKKRDVGWTMMSVVAVMGFIGMVQLIAVENRWRSCRHEKFSHASVDFGKENNTTMAAFRRSSLQHPARLLNASRSPPCDTNCAISEDRDRKRTNVVIETTPKNEKLLQFSPSNTFLPIKDVTQPGLSDTDTNWFMSRLKGSKSASGETFDLPRDDPAGRLLCVRGADPHDGTKNSYGLFQTHKVPADAVVLPGTTFVADNYWDYHNPWHAMSSLANFATWRLQNQCASPNRLLLYHMGELVASMGDWITHVLQAVFSQPIPIETLTDSTAVCFQRAVVQRRGLGGLDRPHIHAVFDMLRRKARRYCGLSGRDRRASDAALQVLLLTRSGPRAFENESGVADVVRKECAKVPRCEMRVLNAANLTFCEQVVAMSDTDVLISVHGAQLTNMMFMDLGSRVMELFPKGWLEFAGVGQEIYKWHAEWTQVIHAGRWRDPLGPDCPFPTSETLKCLFFFKDRKVGLNATHLASWTRDVLVQHGKSSKVQPPFENPSPHPCN